MCLRYLFIFHRYTNSISNDDSISILDWTTNLTTDSPRLNQKRTSTPVHEPRSKRYKKNGRLNENFSVIFHENSRFKSKINIFSTIIDQIEYNFKINFILIINDNQTFIL